MYLYHIAEKDLPSSSLLKGAKVGLQNTVVILEENANQDNFIQTNLSLLTSIDLISWVPFNRISEIIDCFKEVKYKKGHQIIK